MADALKAEGNKLFAEKKFAESMYVTYYTQLLALILTFTVKSSQRLSLSILKTMSSTLIALDLTHL
jgi:hypothetical protein